MARGDIKIQDKKSRAVKLSIFTIAFLVVVKTVASIYTGSVGIRADAFHSLIDLTGALIGFFAVKISSKPPDKDHAFGHGKAENIAGVVIGGLILFAAGTIIYEAVNKLWSGATLELVTVGIYVTIAAVIVNLLVAIYLLKVAKNTESLAIEATARDLLADLYSSLAVLAGLILVQLTGINAFDQVVAFAVALLIGKTAFETIKKSAGGLMDSKLPETEEHEIKTIIRKHARHLVDFHALRTRKSGNQRFVDLHLVVPKDSSVYEAHKLCSHLEEDIKKRVKSANITIHIEPCEIKCESCSAECSAREKNS